MALKASVTSDELAALPETIKEHYKQSTGDESTYVLDAEGVEDVRGLKASVAAARKERDEARTKHREDIEKYKDIDPEKAREAQAKLQEIEDKRLTEAGEFEVLKTNLLSQKETEINTVKSELTGKLEKTTSQLYKVMVRNQLADEFAKQGGIAAASELFLEAAAKNVNISGDDFAISIAEGKGGTIAEYVKNLKETDAFGTLFQADVASGSGASPQNNREGGASKAKKASEMTTQEKAAYIRDNGLAAWQEHLKKG